MAAANAPIIMKEALTFIREYTGKVDKLIKDKIEAQKEEKAKENEEKDVVMQQNMHAQLLSLALAAPPMPGGGMGVGGYAPPPPPCSPLVCHCQQWAPINLFEGLLCFCG